MNISQITNRQDRLKEIGGSGVSVDGIRVLYQRLKLNHEDMKFIRDDVRGARAAYPNVKFEDLTSARWFLFDLSAKVSADGFLNAHCVVDRDTGQKYLESAYLSVVRPEFPNRADAAATERYFTEQKRKQEMARRKRLEEDGPFMMWSGNGSLSVSYYAPKDRVTIKRTEHGASIEKRWRFPFVLDEWLSINESSWADIQTLPSFKSAIPEEFECERFDSSGRWLSPNEAKEMERRSIENDLAFEAEKAKLDRPLYTVGDEVIWRDEKWQWSEDRMEREFLIRATDRKAVVRGSFASNFSKPMEWWYSLHVEGDDGEKWERNAPASQLSYEPNEDVA
jgi:hypothetical protein